MALLLTVTASAGALTALLAAVLPESGLGWWRLAMPLCVALSAWAVLAVGHTSYEARVDPEGDVEFVTLVGKQHTTVDEIQRIDRVAGQHRGTFRFWFRDGIANLPYRMGSQLTAEVQRLTPGLEVTSVEQ
jgi:hypothetical protein